MSLAHILDILNICARPLKKFENLVLKGNLNLGKESFQIKYSEKNKGEIIFFVANRGHHADIGGISPGSMPPFSRTLQEEGACIKTFKLVQKGVFCESGITRLLQAPANIPRNPGEKNISGTRLLSDNLSDLKAQVAANQRGISLLLEMVNHFSNNSESGLTVVQAYMHHIQKNAEEAVRNMLIKLSEIVKPTR